MARVKKTNWIDLEIMKRASPAKLQSFRQGLNLCWKWMRAHGIELPGLVVTEDKNWVPKRTYAAYHNYLERTVAINLDMCSLAKKVHNVYNYTGAFEDFTPAGVLCHEIGHHVDRVLGRRNRGPGKKKGWLSYSKEWMDLFLHEEEISRFEFDVLESFAEAFRLFITNPDLLRVGRLERYEFFVDKLGFRPVKKMTPWRVVLKNATPEHKRAVERWIKRGQE